jgi:hypothetical protein
VAAPVMTPRTVAEEVARERAEQGLPPKVLDPRALARVAQLVHDNQEVAMTLTQRDGE